MDTLWRIEMLGWLRAVQGERIVSRFRRRKNGVLLAYLAYYVDRSHPRESLIEMLWPEGDPQAGRRDFRVALTSLRYQLEPPGVPPGAVLLADRHSVQLNPGACVTDVVQFEAALRAGAGASSSTERGQWLEEAAALYRGELLPGYFDEWVLPERLRLAEAFHHALGMLIELSERSGDLACAIHWARQAVKSDPLREETNQQLIRLLGAAGQPEAALYQYEELRRRLAHELGAEPAEEIQALAQEFKGHSARARAPAVAPTPSPRHSPTASFPPTVAPSSGLPIGTVTLLITDVETPTSECDRAGERFAADLADQRTLLRRLFTEHGGHYVREMEEGFVVLFQRAVSGLCCAVAIQQALTDHPSPAAGSPLLVRMALHTGDVVHEEAEYHDGLVEDAQRLLAAAHGGQILCSESAAALLRRQLEEGVCLADLGVYRLRGSEEPERLFQVQHPGMPRREFPPPRAEAGYASRLPLQFTRFFGREREIARLVALLPESPGTSRLVSSTGPGGTGKTRLAQEAAAQLRRGFGGRIAFVPLVDLSDPELIAGQILDVLRVPRSLSAPPFEQVVAVLSASAGRTLLVVDNLEHLLPEGAAVIEALRQRVECLSLLVTSRQTLGLPEEQELPIAPLPVPEGAVGEIRRLSASDSTNHFVGTRPTPYSLCQIPSVALFVDRAQAVRTDFHLTPANADAVARLCAGLEGIPLALELAAARSGVMSPAQMLERLHERFELLATRRRVPDRRHQSLRTALDWSYQLLSPELQRLFTRLSVFRGGWTLEAAEAVCEEPNAYDYLERLHACSLVRVETPAADEIRFTMLETLREYGIEQLDAEEEAALRRRHASHYRQFAREAQRLYLDGMQLDAMRRMGQEHPNLCAAMTWGLSDRGDPVLTLEMAYLLYHHWQNAGRWCEGLANLEAALAQTAHLDHSRLRCLALDCAGLLAVEDLPQAQAYLEQAHLIAVKIGDAELIAWTELDRAVVLQPMGDDSTAQFLAASAYDRFGQVGHSHGRGWAANRLGALAHQRGDMPAAERFWTEGLACARATQDEGAIVAQLASLGGPVLARGDSSLARALYEEELAIWRRRGNRVGIADALGNLAAVDEYEGEYDRAAALFAESLSLSRESGHPGRLFWALIDMAGIARRRGDLRAAIAYAEEGLALARQTGSGWNLGLAHMTRAEISTDQGDTCLARRHYAECLAIWERDGRRRWMLRCLEGLAGLAARSGNMADGVRLLAAGTALRASLNLPRAHGERSEYEMLVSSLREALGVDAFLGAWSDGEALTIDQAIVLSMGQTGPRASESLPGRESPQARHDVWR